MKPIFSWVCTPQPSRAVYPSFIKGSPIILVFITTAKLNSWFFPMVLRKVGGLMQNNRTQWEYF